MVEKEDEYEEEEEEEEARVLLSPSFSLLHSFSLSLSPSLSLPLSFSLPSCRAFLRSRTRKHRALPPRRSWDEKTFQKKKEK